MPNRILKETICTSEDLTKLSPGAEILFYRLIVRADDYGIYHANPAIVKSTCFPLKSDTIKLRQVETWLSELSNAGLVYIYDAEDGRQYLQFTKWAKHQQIRAKKPKFPQRDINYNQMTSDANKCPRNPIQSNTIQSNSLSEEAAKPKTTKFVPPTIAEVAAYCRERNNGIDAAQFVDYYEARGWLVGKSKMKSWQAAIRTWERNDQSKRESTEDTIDLSWRKNRYQCESNRP